MDSSTPDPQQQPAAAQQQPQHQHHPQQQQQQSKNQQQPHPQPHQHQPHPDQPAPSGPYQSMHAAAYPPPRYATTSPYYGIQPQYYAHAYQFTYPQRWVPPANYNPAPTQPLSNMVNPQPQTNVPQQHNKPSSQILNPVINTDRSHNQSLQAASAPNQAAAARIRERKPAILKDPSTNKEVPLPNTTISTTKSSSSAAKQSSNALTTTNTTTSVEHVHTLLQKVSEDNNSSLETNNKQQQIKKSTLVSSTAEEKKSGIDANKTSANEAIATNLSTTSTATTTTTVTTTTTPSVPHETTMHDKKPAVEKSAEADKLKEDPIIRDGPVPMKQQPVQTLLRKVSEEGQENSEVISNGRGSLNKQPATNESTPSSPTSTAPTATTTATTTSITEPATITTSSISAAEKESAEITNETKQIDQDSSPEVEASIPGKDKIDETEAEIEAKGDTAKDNAGDDSKNDEQDQDPFAALNYEPGQYHPITNRTGKRIYSKQFLLDVCEKIIKIDLLHQESDDNIGMEGNRLQSAFSEKIDLFAPAYSSSSQRYTPTNRQNEPSRRQSQHNYAGRSSAGQERQRKVITSVSLTQEVELKTASNPWRPTKEIKEDAPTDELETESLKKRFRSILNKLTPNNFENLAKAVTDLNIDTEAKLGEVIDIVFAKALAEPGYCVLYGQMCSHLKKITAGTANFGNTLLKRCQNQFQSDIYSGIDMQGRKEKIEKEESKEVKKQLQEELYEEMYRCRMRGLGLIKFIGELYKIQMLNDKIMFECVLRLLSDTSEESLECLCDLLTTIGEKLDRSSQNNAEKEKKAPKSASKANAYQGGQKSAAAVVASGSTASQQQQQQKLAEQQTAITSLDQVFEQLHKIRKNKDLDLPVRIRFKLLDTCELREKDNWQSKKTKDNNPKKIEEIREAHKEKLEQERRQQNAMGPRRSQEGRRGLGHSTGSSSQISSLANESGGMRGTSNMHTSASSHLIRDHSVGDNMKSNHNDIETQKEHQRKVNQFITSSMLLKEPSQSSSSEPLRPLRLTRTTGSGGGGGAGLRPVSSLIGGGSSSVSQAAVEPERQD